MSMTSVQLKQLEYKLARNDEHNERDVLTIPGVIVAQLMRQAVKDSMRNMEGHA